MSAIGPGCEHCNYTGHVRFDDVVRSCDVCGPQRFAGYIPRTFGARDAFPVLAAFVAAVALACVGWWLS